MTFFTQILLSLNVLTLIVVCVIATRYSAKTHLKVIRFMLYYSTVGSVATLLLTAINRRILYNEACNLDVLVDISFIYFYFRSVLIGENLRKTLFVLYLAFVCLSLFLWFGPPHLFQSFISPFYGTCNLFIMIPCFFYFYEIFRSDFETNYKKDSNFYIVSAIFFVYGVTMPFYFGYNTIVPLSKSINEILGDINCIIWIIYYITLALAFTLPGPNNKVEVLK